MQAKERFQEKHFDGFGNNEQTCQISRNPKSV